MPSCFQAQVAIGKGVFYGLTVVVKSACKNLEMMARSSSATVEEDRGVWGNV